MIKKSVWLCAILATLSSAPTAYAQEINSWADLLPLIEGRGEPIVRRMELVPGRGLDLGRNVNVDYQIRAQLTELSQNDTGQLLEVSLTRKILPEDDLPDLPEGDEESDRSTFLNYALLDGADDDGPIQFSPIRYEIDVDQTDLLKFYVYLPGPVMSNPKGTLKISYAIDAEKNRSGSFYSIFPGCFKIKSGIEEIDHGRREQDIVSQTCPWLFEQNSTALDNWDIADGLTGSGWLRAGIRDGQNEFEGLILVLQPDGYYLDLSTPAACDSPESDCEEVAENDATVVQRLIEEVYSSKYYALAVGPVNPANGAAIDPITGTLENSTIGGYMVTTEEVFPLEKGRGIYILSLPPAPPVGDYPGVNISMDVSGRFGEQDCTARVSFAEGLSDLAAPVIFNCVDDEAEPALLPQISETILPDETIAGEIAGGVTIQLRSALTDLDPSITNSGLGERESFISTGACDGYDGPPAQEGELQLFCLSGDLGSEKLTFRYKSIAYMGPTDDIRESGLNTREVALSNWTINADQRSDVTIQFIGNDVSPSFWQKLAISQSLVLDSAEDSQLSEVEFLVDEEAGTVSFSLPEMVTDKMLADRDSPAFQIAVTTGVGKLAEPAGINRTSLAYFPSREARETLNFILDMNDILTGRDLVVSLDVRVKDYLYAGETIDVWAVLPRAKKVLMPCSVGIRIAQEDYWLVPNADQTGFTFPSNFPRVSDTDALTVIAGPLEGENIEPESAAEKLCPKSVEAIAEVLVPDMEDSGAIRVPLTRPVLAYFLRTATSDDVYGTRNSSDIYRVGFAPVLELQQERVVAFYRPIRGSGGARSFEPFNRISAIDPFTSRDMEGRVGRQLSDIMQGYLPDGSVSVEKALRGAVLDREDFGISGEYWPDIVILTSGDRPFTCRTIEAALFEVETTEGLEGIGAANATLSVYYDNFRALDSGRAVESVQCETGSNFGRVNLFKTSLSGLFNTGRGRFGLADEVQRDWEAVVWELAGEVED